MGLFGSGYSAPVNPPICPNCEVLPVALNPATGQYFGYCSRPCATNARGYGVNQSGRQMVPLCQQCMQRPKFADATRVYRHCSKTCAKPPGSNGSTFANSVPLTIQGDGNPTIPWMTTPGRVFWTPGCTIPAFVHPNGVMDRYCSSIHRQWVERGCISCRAAPVNGPFILCQLCHNNVLRVAPVIIEVPEDHDGYKSVATKFQKSWRDGTKRPPVRAIYKIITTEKNMKKYNEYRDKTERKGNFVAVGRSPGNENRRWHGTQRKCNIGDKGVTNFCTDSGCSLCCILKTSFDIRFVGRATDRGIYGAGIYTFSTSSKSNPYSRNAGITSEWKALLLNKVVVGKGKKIAGLSLSSAKPPQGYDSILADASPGVDGNDELVVFHNDAVRPSYLVMYEA